MIKHIDEFEVDIDVSERMTMYDYGTCRYLHRTASHPPGWRHVQLVHLGGTDHIDKQDENMMMQVLLDHFSINP